MIKLKLLGLGIIFCCSFFASANIWAESTHELQKQMKALQKTVEELKIIIQKQNERIDQLTGEKQKTKVKIETITPSGNKEETRSLGMWKYPVSSPAAKMLPDISLIGVFSGAYFQNDPAESGHDPHRTGFNLQEIEVGIQSIIDPYVRGDIFLSFHEDGVELEEGYITTLAGLPKGLQIRAGKYKVGFGRQNQKHLETWSFINNNLPDKYFFGGDGFNELGTEVSYLLPTPFFLQAQFSFNQGTNAGNFDGTRKEDFAYTGRLSTSANITDNLTALAGISAAFGYNDTGLGNTTNLYGGDFLLKWKPSKDKGIEWQSEYIFRRKEVPGAFENEGGLSSYLLGNWSPRWGAGLRAEYLGLPAETEKTFRMSPMLTFRPSEFFRLKAQYDLTKNIGDNVEHAAMLQMIFNMGPHGAHNF
ncbi:MAG: hypothetical protein HQM15_01575 [Deltaproteobacteria bacterium]|nr:hypothetical protein [Deltaproteobacteria bacterium]